MQYSFSSRWLPGLQIDKRDEGRKRRRTGAATCLWVNYKVSVDLFWFTGDETGVGESSARSDVRLKFTGHCWLSKQNRICPLGQWAPPCVLTLLLQTSNPFYLRFKPEFSPTNSTLSLLMVAQLHHNGIIHLLFKNITICLYHLQRSSALKKEYCTQS